VWTGAEKLATNGIRAPDGPARSELLYRARYSGPSSYLRVNLRFSGTRTLFQRSSRLWHMHAIGYCRCKLKPTVSDSNVLKHSKFGKLLQSSKINFLEPRFLLVMQRGVSMTFVLVGVEGSSFEYMCYGCIPPPFPNYYFF
jgi:hypothetical protein